MAALNLYSSRTPPPPVRERRRQRHQQPAGSTGEYPAIGRVGVSGPQSPARWEIRVEGALDQRWTAWFEGLQVTSEGSQRVISGPLPDQPALHGVLIKVRDLGMCLISVRRLDPNEAGEASPP